MQPFEPSPQPGLQSFSFKLVLQLNPEDSDVDVLVERLFEAGCGDALIGLGLPGYLGLSFIREAKNAEEAVQSAISQVNSAIPSAIRPAALSE